MITNQSFFKIDFVNKKLYVKSPLILFLYRGFMKKIILATKNSHKTNEFSIAFDNHFIIEDLGTLHYEKDIIENGATFIENAIIKCETIYKEFGLPVLSDDSGLSVKSLGGKPGVYSARYGGEKYVTDKDRYTLLLSEMDGVTDREASFVCALVYYETPTKIYIIQEEVKGFITKSPVGDNGFGYDPVFFVPQYAKTMAQLSGEEKNKISHRGKAASLMKQLLLK